MRKIRRGDEVIVISGRNKGQRGRVRIVIPDKDRVVIEGVNLVKRHRARARARQAGIIEMEAKIRANGLPPNGFGMRTLKAMGFSDARLAVLAGLTEAEVTARRHELNVRPVFKRVDTCAAEFEAQTPYLYSTYETPQEETVDGRPVTERMALIRSSAIRSASVTGEPSDFSSTAIRPPP